MSGEDIPTNVKRGMTFLIVVLLLFGIGLFIAGEYLFAGVTFLSLTFAIYFRETW